MTLEFFAERELCIPGEYDAEAIEYLIRAGLLHESVSPPDIGSSDGDGKCKCR